MSYSGNLLVENRNGLIVDAEAFEANGTAERDAALIMLEKLQLGRPSLAPGTYFRLLLIAQSFQTLTRRL